MLLGNHGYGSVRSRSEIYGPDHLGTCTTSLYWSPSFGFPGLFHGSLYILHLSTVVALVTHLERLSPLLLLLRVFAQALVLALRHHRVLRQRFC